jgi:hypothetical protein
MTDMDYLDQVAREFMQREVPYELDLPSIEQNCSVLAKEAILGIKAAILATEERCVGANTDLLAAVSTFVERWDAGDRADTDYVASLMKNAIRSQSEEKAK